MPAQDIVYRTSTRNGVQIITKNVFGNSQNRRRPLLQAEQYAKSVLHAA